VGVVDDATPDRHSTARGGSDNVGGGKTPPVLLQTLDTEQLLADRFLAIRQ
jgi:hypothetical protein